MRLELSAAALGLSAEKAMNAPDAVQFAPYVIGTWQVPLKLQASPLPQSSAHNENLWRLMFATRVCADVRKAICLWNKCRHPKQIQEQHMLWQSQLLILVLHKRFSIDTSHAS